MFGPLLLRTKRVERVHHVDSAGRHRCQSCVQRCSAASILPFRISGYGSICKWPLPCFTISAAPEFTKREISRRRNTMSEKNEKQTSELSMDELENVDRKSTRLNSSHLGISYAVF